MNMRFVVNTHLLQKRFEVWLAVLLPLFLILESGIANAWVYAGGNFLLDTRTAIALFRGLFFEVLTFSCFKLARILAPQKTKEAYIGLAIVLFVGMWCILVSAGNNLGWILAGGEMGGILAAVGKSMPALLYQVYQIGLGLLLPIAVGGIALVDVEHLVHHTIDSTIDLDTRVLQLEESDMHKAVYKDAQQEQKEIIREEYKGLAADRAKRMTSRVKGGDMTFGAKATSSAATPGLRRADAAGLPLVPAAISLPQLPAPSAQSATPPALTGQFTAAPDQSTGTTQNIVLPPVSAQGAQPSGSKRFFG